jgi:hypothetical protein
VIETTTPAASTTDRQMWSRCPRGAFITAKRARSELPT